MIFSFRSVVDRFKPRTAPSSLSTSTTCKPARAHTHSHKSWDSQEKSPTECLSLERKHLTVWQSYISLTSKHKSPVPSRSSCLPGAGENWSSKWNIATNFYISMPTTLRYSIPLVNHRYNSIVILVFVCCCCWIINTSTNSMLTLYTTLHETRNYRMHLQTFLIDETWDLPPIVTRGPKCNK